jgi:hypothetical protein
MLEIHTADDILVNNKQKTKKQGKPKLLHHTLWPNGN